MQQLVKIAFVLQSETPEVLIIEADTMLLKPRNWPTSSGDQVLAPTVEWHQDYYDFLQKVRPHGWSVSRY